jgi:hypothetical protein
MCVPRSPSDRSLPVERTAELLAELLDAPVSTGWLCQVQLSGREIVPFITGLKERLAGQPVVCADQTGTRVKTPNTGFTPSRPGCSPCW